MTLKIENNQQFTQDLVDPKMSLQESPCILDSKNEKDQYPYLSCLNEEQLKGKLNPGNRDEQRSDRADLIAVTASPSAPLQILAGPGSGKTRVLTSRVAYLVQKHGFKPYEITAVTFTNKAANEMRKRLRVLLGEKQADNLVLGESCDSLLSPEKRISAHTRYIPCYVRKVPEEIWKTYLSPEQFCYSRCG